MRILTSQTVTSSWGGRRKLPLVFTEHGAIRAASVLNSERAVQMSVYVVRAFVQLRQLMVDHKVLADKLDALERFVSHHDNSLVALIDAIRALTEPPKPPNDRLDLQRMCLKSKKYDDSRRICCL